MNERPEWFDNAICKGQTHLFFPAANEVHLAAKAKKLCAECPVRDECYEYSLELTQRYDTFGVWAGVNKPTREAVLHEQGLLNGERIAYDPVFVRQHRDV